MLHTIPISWTSFLLTELAKPYITNLMEAVENSYQNSVCFPPKDFVFNALKLCNPIDVKVVILGQDPYHGFGQANGLAFSVYDGVKWPPSLTNIFKEVATDLDVALPLSGNLERWAAQGVLLLNNTLTVEEKRPISHAKLGWSNFTDAIIKTLSDQNEDIVFMLWGGFAQKKAKLIDANKHKILLSGHPSPLSANRGFWFGNKHFSNANEFLKSKNKAIIAW
jgi:uracil-DNA glycosylase